MTGSFEKRNLETVKSFEEIEALQVLNVLKSYVENGHLLHGSKKQLEVIEPRRAQDMDPNRLTGNQFGVYAANDVRAPILTALFDKKDPQKDSWTSYSGTDNLSVSGENFTFTPGYVHVLPRDSFEEVKDDTGDVELISKQPVKPVNVLYVKPAVLKVLPGVTISEQ